MSMIFWIDKKWFVSNKNLFYVQFFTYGLIFQLDLLLKNCEETWKLTLGFSAYLHSTLFYRFAFTNKR